MTGVTSRDRAGADASARRAEWRTPSSKIGELVTESRPVAPWKPLIRPAAPGSRRIGAAAWGRRGLRPLARTIPRQEPVPLRPSERRQNHWPFAGRLSRGPVRGQLVYACMLE